MTTGWVGLVATNVGARGNASARANAGTSPSGRIALRAAIAAAGLTIAAGLTPARAQDWSFWPQLLPGFASNTPGGAPPDERRRRRAAEADQSDDLREGEMPLRSREMLTTIDDAIARLERVVADGGWPTIPGSRMIRPGDDDARRQGDGHYCAL